MDTIRELDESGRLRASRTAGGHRRFRRDALDAYLARTGGRTPQPAQQPARNTHRLPLARPLPPTLEDDFETFEPDDVSAPPIESGQPVPIPPPNSVEAVMREIKESRKREAAEAARARLLHLKQFGMLQIGWGVPDACRANVAAALEGYVSPQNFPQWISDLEAYGFVRARVQEVLKPYYDRAERDQRAVRDRQQIQALIEGGKRYAHWETMDWDPEDRQAVRREVESQLLDVVEADWTEDDVKDEVNEVLDEWADESEEEEAEDEES